tara:strand:+ start:35 stop:211 length:177 start_codon:yes stop_codon:yes gene_type:complete
MDLTILIYALTGLIGYLSYRIGAGQRERVIAQCVEYLIKEGYLLTDDQGDIKVRSNGS